MGARCHLPTAKVESPRAFSSCAIVAARSLIAPRPLGKARAQFETERMPTVWWLRPVSRQAREGEQSVVVW